MNTPTKVALSIVALIALPARGVPDMTAPTSPPDTLREAVARIVDPEAMRSAEDWYTYYREGYPEWSDDACQDKAIERLSDTFRHFEPVSDAEITRLQL
jgi:hypothetical protein